MANKPSSKYQCQWCQVVWEEEQLVADAFVYPFTLDGDVDIEKLSCGYSFCEGPVVRLPDRQPHTLVVYEDTLMANPPPPEDEFPF